MNEQTVNGIVKHFLSEKRNTSSCGVLPQSLTIYLINATLIHVYLWAQHWVLSVCYILLIIYNCLVSAGAARKLSRLNGDPFFNSGPNDKKDDQHHPEQRLASTSHSLPRPSLGSWIIFVDVNLSDIVDCEICRHWTQPINFRRCYLNAKYSTKSWL